MLLEGTGVREKRSSCGKENENENEVEVGKAERKMDPCTREKITGRGALVLSLNSEELSCPPCARHPPTLQERFHRHFKLVQ